MRNSVVMWILSMSFLNGCDNVQYGRDDAMKDATLAFVITNGATYHSGRHNIDSGRIDCRVSFSNPNDFTYVVTNLWRLGWRQNPEVRSSLKNVLLYRRPNPVPIAFRVYEDLKLMRNGNIVRVVID